MSLNRPGSPRAICASIETFR
ncbi:hypothetical protein FMM06_14295 [Glacieibacterium frigidum]|uniref:Uncharacterized protein n=1 Tax=Glacieibacterium frigidum TaxID=2593303 RepID=A0A552UAT6_9SPHN|nr:hypothetical protein FMM06_14295 [Glacieibacterium frigidum]